MGEGAGLIFTSPGFLRESWCARSILKNQQLGSAKCLGKPIDGKLICVLTTSERRGHLGM